MYQHHHRQLFAATGGQREVGGDDEAVSRGDAVEVGLAHLLWRNGGKAAAQPRQLALAVLRGQHRQWLAVVANTQALACRGDSTSVLRPARAT